MKIRNDNIKYLNVDCIKKMVHLAVQYLAAANDSFLDKKPYENYINLELCKITKCIKTKPLTADGDTLELLYDNFSLLWKCDNKFFKKQLPLDRATHKEIVHWVSKTAKEAGLSKPYKYAYNRDLPYHEITNGFTFKILDQDRLNNLFSYRLIAQDSLEVIINSHNLNAEIMICPFDFDTSAYALLNSQKDIALSFGMTVANFENVDPEHFVYIKGWHGLHNVETTSFPEIKYGRWNSSNWEGAIMSLNNVSDNKTVIDFFDETIRAYTTRFYREVI